MAMTSTAGAAEIASGVEVRRVRPRREVVLLLLLYVAYSAGRMLADADWSAAQRTGRAILAVEDQLGLDVERGLNLVVSGIPPVAVLASYWYALFHYTVTPAALFWLFRRRHDAYGRERSALVLASVLGLVGFVALPTAPPRLLEGGRFVDTLATYSGYGWWGAEASAPRGLGALTNQLAAMPSLHVGWAFWVGLVLVRHANARWATAGVAYAGVSTVVVVVTGNHYVLDAVAGIAVVLVADRAVRWRHCRHAAVAAEAIVHEASPSEDEAGTLAAVRLPDPRHPQTGRPPDRCSGDRSDHLAVELRGRRAGRSWPAG